MRWSLCLVAVVCGATGLSACAHPRYSKQPPVTGFFYTNAKAGHAATGLTADLSARVRESCSYQIAIPGLGLALQLAGASRAAVQAAQFAPLTMAWGDASIAKAGSPTPTPVAVVDQRHISVLGFVRKYCTRLVPALALSP